VPTLAELIEDETWGLFVVIQFRVRGLQTLKIQVHRSIILSLVLYGRETWSLTLREELRLGTHENRVSRRIFGPMREEETGGWRKLLIETFHNFYSSPNTCII
jgi:hypothetical protein